MTTSTQQYAGGARRPAHGAGAARRRVGARLRVLVAALACIGAAQALAQVTLYEHADFAGRSIRVIDAVPNLRDYGFNDRASSLVVEGGRWEVCEDARFGGRCIVLRRGDYPSMAAIGLNDRISSLRAVRRGARNWDADTAYYAGSYEYRRRGNEPLYSAPVTSVRAVFGSPEQRCWIEREQVPASSNVNVPGAIAGAVIGGIIGHQIGGGRGQDIATAGGAVGGAALGANIGRDGGVVTRDVQRCSYAHGDRPAYWDVTYAFRGVQHHVQTTEPPGNTILVNREGEPRV